MSIRGFPADVRIVAGSGVSIDEVGNVITISSNTSAFSTVSVSGQSDVVADQLSDTLTLVAGSGIGITTNAGSDSVTITNTNTAFSTVAVSNFGTTQSNVVADALADTLTLTSGANMDISTNASTDTLTIKTWDSETRTVGTYTLAASSATVQGCDCAGGQVVINLPLASTCHGKIFIFHQMYASQTASFLIQRQGSDLIVDKSANNNTSRQSSAPGAANKTSWLIFQADGPNSIWREFGRLTFGNNLLSASVGNDAIDFGYHTSDTTNTTLSNSSHPVRTADMTTGDLTYTLTMVDRKMYMINKSTSQGAVILDGGSNTFNNISGFTTLTLGSSGSIGDSIWIEGDTAPNPDTWRILARTDLHKWAYRTYAANFTADYGSWNKITATLTATLPTAVNRAGEIIAFKLSAGSVTLTLNTTSSQTIDGRTSISFGNQYDCVRVISDGANWFISDSSTSVRLRLLSSTGSMMISCPTLAASRNITLADPGANALIGMTKQSSGLLFASGSVTLDGSNPTTVATGLNTIQSATATIKKNSTPGSDPFVITVNFTGSDGNLDIYAWKTDGTLAILTASTNNATTICWTAFGT